MRKIFNIIVLVILLCLFNVNVNASSAKCTYHHENSVGADKWDITVSIDENLNINTKITGNTFVEIDNNSTSLVVGELINTTTGELKCKDTITYKSTGTKGKKTFYGFSFSTYSLTLPLSNAEVINDGTGVTVVRTCNYGNYRIDVLSNGSLKGYNPNYNVSVSDTAGKFKNGCPDNIFIKEANGGHREASSAYIDTVNNNGKTTYRDGVNPNNTGELTTKKIDLSGPSGCKNILGDDVTNILHNILKTIQYAGPILVAIMTIIDLVKASLSGEQDELKKMMPKFIKRLVAAMLLFFIPLLVNLIFDIILGISIDNVCI